MNELQCITGWKDFSLALCRHVRPALEYFPTTEPRPSQAIDTVEKWAKGEKGVDSGDLQQAADIVYAFFTVNEEETVARDTIYSAIKAISKGRLGAKNAMTDLNYALWSYKRLIMLQLKCVEGSCHE